MGFLLDTSAAILIRDVDTADHRLAKLTSIPALSIVTRIELEGGAAPPSPMAAQRRAALDAMLRLFTVIDFDTACAEVYREIVVRGGFSRRKTLDRMIAATALVHRLTVVTANEADFADVAGLKLLAWPSR